MMTSLANGTSPYGEDNSPSSTFSAEDVANAFEVDINRVERAMRGEFGLQPTTQITSHQAQALAEVILAERPLAGRQAALMQLGAFTPRSDVEWGFGDTEPGEESDRLAASPDKPDDERASKRSSFDPATQESD
jgi:hypothetical protein